MLFKTTISGKYTPLLVLKKGDVQFFEKSFKFCITWMCVPQLFDYYHGYKSYKRGTRFVFV